jgi:predicted nucleic acid-binding protein
VSFYLDASALVPSLVRDAHSDAVGRFLRTASEPIWVSDFAAAEVSSALSRLVRMGMLNGQEALIRLSEFDAYRSTLAGVAHVDRIDIVLADRFVRRFDLGLRAPDALHAAVCQRSGHVLVTLDHRLARAAGFLGVDVEMPA